MRRRELTLAAMALAGGIVDAEDTMVDFSNATLYLSGMQTVFTVVTVACVSVLACWVAPEGGVSAVRTLALCTAVGALLMRTPLRIGRAHGVNVVFSSLQPAVAVYILGLVVEQLVHTCATETQHTPSWRRVVFHGAILVMCAAGLMRARFPMRDTDVPFLITSGALLAIAVLPPPSVALVGPLCQPVDAWQAAERCLRAFVFAVLYSVHVYSSISTNSPTRSESMVVITRSAAAAIWTMGSHLFWLPLAIVQAMVVIMARIRISNTVTYEPVSNRPLSAPSEEDAGDAAYRRSITEECDLENGGAINHHNHQPQDPVEHQRQLLADVQHARGGVTDALFSKVVLPVHAPAPPPHPPAAPLDRRSPRPESRNTEEELDSVPAADTGGFGPLRFREVQGDPLAQQPVANSSSSSMTPSVLRAEDMTAERMRDIVNSLENDS